MRGHSLPEGQTWTCPRLQVNAHTCTHSLLCLFRRSSQGVKLIERDQLASVCVTHRPYPFSLLHLNHSVHLFHACVHVCTSVPFPDMHVCMHIRSHLNIFSVILAELVLLGACCFDTQNPNKQSPPVPIYSKAISPKRLAHDGQHD